MVSQRYQFYVKQKKQTKNKTSKKTKNVSPSKAPEIDLNEDDEEEDPVSGLEKGVAEDEDDSEEEEEEDVDDMFAIDTAEKKTRKVKKISVCMRIYSVRQ